MKPLTTFFALFVALAMAALMETAWAVAHDFPKHSHPAVTARGVVFEDLNNNASRDQNEPGVRGVRVSDGISITVTDDQGRWSLEIGEEALIFVTKPSGYGTPLSKDKLPRFYYIHQPQGSPEGLSFGGIEPTGPLPASIDFPLYRKQEPVDFDLLLFADTQPQDDAELDYIRDDVINGLIGSKAAFGMTVGDLLFDDLAMFPRYIQLIGRIGIPWYNVPGNHELNFKALDDNGSLDTFKRYFGPPYYSFEVGDALFVVLDNIQYKGTAASDPDDPRGNGGYFANIGERQLRWLELELQHVPQEKLVFLAMHSPLKTYAAPDSDSVNTQDRKQLFSLLSGRPNLYSVAGHTHTTEHHYFGEEQGFAGPGEFHHHVLATVCGAWWSGPLDDRGVPSSMQRDGTPNGYHIVSIQGSDVSVRYQAAGERADYQMRVLFNVANLEADPVASQASQLIFRHGELSDGRLPLSFVPESQVLVNLFDGGPRSQVTFRIDDGKPQPMQLVHQPDPAFVELFQRHPESLKSWVKPVASSHLFAADLPDDLGQGIYTVTIRAQDEFNQVHHSHVILEVTSDKR